MKQKVGRILGELESEIMSTVWESHEPISIRYVTDILRVKRKIAYTTIMTIMVRLVEKGLLKRTSEGKAYRYQAVYSKEKFLNNITKQIIKNFVSSFGETAVASFVQEINKIPDDKKQKLLKMLKDAND